MKNLTDSITIAILKKQYKDIYDAIQESCGNSLDFTQDDISKVWDLCKSDEDKNRLVIAVCLVLFSRHTIIAGIKVKKGLATAIANCKGVKQEAVSNMISTSVYWYGIYPSFKTKVDGIANIYKGVKDAA